MNLPRLSLVALAISLTLLSGCSNARGRASVMARFPDADVAMIPDTNGKWIVRQPDGSVWYAMCDGFGNSTSPGVINIVQILPPK